MTVSLFTLLHVSIIIFLLVGINLLEKKENNFVILKRGFRSRRSHVICEVLLWVQRDKP